MRFIVMLLLSLCVLTACKKEEESREERLGRIETQGTHRTEEAARMVAGAGEALSSEGVRASERVAGGLVNMAMGAIKGADESLKKSGLEYPLTVNTDLANAGLVVPASVFSERFTGTSLSGSFPVNIYLIFDNAYKGSLYLRAYNAEGQEIGRSDRQYMDMSDDEAEHVNFTFPSQTAANQISRVELYQSKN